MTIWKKLNLPELSRRGGLEGVVRQVSANLAVVQAQTRLEQERIEESLREGTNTAADNERWTTAAIDCCSAHREARAFLASYLVFLGEEAQA